MRWAVAVSECSLFVYFCVNKYGARTLPYQEQRVRVDLPGLAKGADCHNLHGCAVRAVDSSSSSIFSRMLSFFYVNAQGARRNAYQVCRQHNTFSASVYVAVAPEVHCLRIRLRRFAGVPRPPGSFIRSNSKRLSSSSCTTAYLLHDRWQNAVVSFEI